jgi:low temperature requirement protein LtrA
MRERKPHEHHRVTYVELFFDLVFVFAVTQISHTLLAHFTPLGVLETTLLFLAVWWVWIFTSWITNWLNPDRLPVRLLLFALMLAGLVMSMSIPKAFESRGLIFAVAFAGMQIGRNIFMALAIPAGQSKLRMNFIRILVYLSCSGVFWIAGGLAEGEQRLMLWSIALLIEYISPYTNFYIPGLGASSVKDWTVEGGHMAERCALFIIIALGESVLVTGATFAELSWTATSISAFGASFIGSLTMWWIYFHKGAEAGAENITHASDPGRLARLGYTYLHLLIVAGIIVAAVGDELVLAHPDGHASPKAVLSLVGGPLLFLVGVILFKRTIHGWFQLSHLVGIVLLMILAPFGHLLSPLWLSAAATGALVVVAAWEAISIGAKPTVVNKALYRAQRVN